MASGPLVFARNIRFPVYLAAGQMLHVSGKADVLDCQLVIQNTEKSWEMRVFDASLDTLRAPILVGKWLWALLTLARGGGIDLSNKQEATRVSRVFFLDTEGQSGRR